MQVTKTLIGNSDRLSEHARRLGERITVNSGELPTCLIKQVTKIRDGTFSAVGERQHLWGVTIMSARSSRFEFALLTIRSVPYVEFAQP